LITIEPDLLGINDGDITLDAGCGDGRHSWEVYNRNHSAVVAFDIDAVCVKKNKYVLESLRQQKEVRGEYHLLVASVTKLPFDLLEVVQRVLWFSRWAHQNIQDPGASPPCGYCWLVRLWCSPQACPSLLLLGASLCFRDQERKGQSSFPVQPVFGVGLAG
jgi:hypothetical protein